MIADVFQGLELCQPNGAHANVASASLQLNGYYVYENRTRDVPSGFQFPEKPKL